MSRSGISIYQNSRNKAKLSREEAADQLHVSPRQLARYESLDPNEFTKPEEEVVAIMVETYNDPMLALQHALMSPVVRKLLTKDVNTEGSLLHIITRLGRRCSHFVGQVLELQDVALDDKIDLSEMHLWEDAQGDADEIIAAALAMKLIQTDRKD